MWSLFLLALVPVAGGGSDDDGDSIQKAHGAFCRNTCTESFSVRVCGEPATACFRWAPQQVFCAFAFFGMAVGGIVTGLSMSSRGCVKVAQWTTALVGMVCFTIVVSYSSAESRAQYDEHMWTQFAVACVFLTGWGSWGMWRWHRRQRRAVWLREIYAGEYEEEEDGGGELDGRVPGGRVPGGRVPEAATPIAQRWVRS